MRRFAAFLAVLFLATPAYAAKVIPYPVTVGAKTGGFGPQNGNYTGPTVTQAVIAYVVPNGNARTGSFGGAPAVGDLLVAGCFGTNEPVDAVAGAGWTAISSSASGANTRGRIFTYLYVVTPSVTSYTPCTNPATGVQAATVIFDISGANATWATAFQSPVVETVANSTGPAACNTAAAKNNTVALAMGASDTSGGSTFTDMTFTGITTGKVTPGTSLTNNYAAGAYGTFRYAGSGVSLTTSGVWTGGAGGSATICDLILLNP